MQFLDEVKIYIASGKGGSGCSSFRREKFTPKGGPDGGNGGNGGDLIFKANPDLNTLIDYRYQQHFKAPAGGGGRSKDRNGRSGQPLYLEVPVGTQVINTETGENLYDFTFAGEEYIALKGGERGLGNTNFKSSTNRAPRESTPGEEGGEMWVRLQLKLLSDVGLLGMPNAGKSTLLSNVSRARPKIADYAFTTLNPKLGVVYVAEEEFVLADIPGLLEGAHTGYGLGDRFLKHLERCTALLHVLSAEEKDLKANYLSIRDELGKYGKDLKNKPELVALSKTDLVTEEEKQEKLNNLKQVTDSQVMEVNIDDKQTTNLLMKKMLEILNKAETLEEE